MNPYRQFLFPRLLDWTMNDAKLERHRRDLLARVRGDVFEVGFGTGLNLPHYADAVTSLTAIDANPGMRAIAQKRIERSPLPVRFETLNGERLPLESDRFDSAVSTWTLCSIGNIRQAIAEIARVLKPGGAFYFIEHGISPDAGVRTWQNRLNGLQQFIGDGCNLNRHMPSLIEPHFDRLEVEEFYLPDLPRHIGYTYKGVAYKAP